jgi:hypothetical protein
MLSQVIGGQEKSTPLLMPEDWSPVKVARDPLTTGRSGPANAHGLTAKNTAIDMDIHDLKCLCDCIFLPIQKSKVVPRRLFTLWKTPIFWTVRSIFDAYFAAQGPSARESRDMSPSCVNIK